MVFIPFYSSQSKNLWNSSLYTAWSCDIVFQRPHIRIKDFQRIKQKKSGTELFMVFMKRFTLSKTYVSPISKCNEKSHRLIIIWSYKLFNRAHVFVYLFKNLKYLIFSPVDFILISGKSLEFKCWFISKLTSNC